MLTSRAEFRLLLREDNTVDRLMPIGRRLGLVDDARWRRFEAWQASSPRRTSARSARRVTGTRRGQRRARAARLGAVRRPPRDARRAAAPARARLARGRADRRGRRDRRERQRGRARARRDRAHATTATCAARRPMPRLARADAVRVPDDLDYRAIPGLSSEVVEKLEAIRPRSVGQASRISGVTPAAVAILLTHIGLVERRKAVRYASRPLMKLRALCVTLSARCRVVPQLAPRAACSFRAPGAVSTSRAGAAVASADDGEALVINPAGLAKSTGTTITIVGRDASTTRWSSSAAAATTHADRGRSVRGPAATRREERREPAARHRPVPAGPGDRDRLATSAAGAGPHVASRPLRAERVPVPRHDEGQRKTYTFNADFTTPPPPSRYDPSFPVIDRPHRRGGIEHLVVAVTTRRERAGRRLPHANVEPVVDPQLGRSIRAGGWPLIGFARGPGVRPDTSSVHVGEEDTRTGAAWPGRLSMTYSLRTVWWTVHVESH